MAEELRPKARLGELEAEAITKKGNDMPQTLFEISADMQALEDLLDGADFDDPAVQEALAKWSDELSENLQGKVDNYAAFIETLNARAAARKDEANRLDKRAKIDANNADKLKENLKRVLEFRGLKSLDTLRYKVTVAGTGGKQSVECLVKPEDLPADLRTVVPESYKQNTDAIRAKLLAGEKVPGCRLLEKGTHLRIS